MDNNYRDLSKNLNSRNIEFKYLKNRKDIINEIDVLTKDCLTIGIGNSKSLKSLEISKHLKQSGKKVYDKTDAIDKLESNGLKKLALTSDCFISSSNAIALTGEIVNVDHSGNRIAAITYGPDKVILIIGTNKIVENESLAIARALKVATPRNALRAGANTPCSLGKPCSNCNKDVRVCNYVSIVRGQNEASRMIVILIDENLGF
ncbi:MAG: lactate utilization protein [Acidaminobacteraceae bacterium]